MTTVEATNDYAKMFALFPPGSDIFLRGQTFDSYENFIEKIGEASGLRISFDGENIKIMTLSTKHEKYVRFIEMIITALSLKIRQRILHFGSATMKSSRQERGSEPDCCFYIQNAEFVAQKDSIDFSTDVPPDLVVEIDVHHSSLEKFEIYARLKVPEFWLYDGERLRIYQLENESYRAVKKSLALPILTDAVLSDFLKRLENSDQYEILLEFEKWLEESK